MHIRRIIALILVIIVIAIVAPVSYRAALQSKESGDKKGIQLIEMWQIDGFEGGKGSRASYLSRAAEKCFEGQNIYFKVTSLTADAARANISSGRAPDLISYSAGFYGIEELVNEKYPAYTWCSGRYCLISLDASADFSDANSENIVINEGKDNLVGVCAALEGFGEVDSESSVNAYLKLLDGSYKYLLGTQRDIFRFISREVEYCVKPLTAFNDLYQNISVLTTEREKCSAAEKFIEYLKVNGDVTSLGLFSDKSNYSDNAALNLLETATPLSRLSAYCTQDYIEELKEAAKSGDINKIKNLLK